jgi:hypothetical protein
MIMCASASPRNSAFFRSVLSASRIHQVLRDGATSKLWARWPGGADRLRKKSFYALWAKERKLWVRPVTSFEAGRKTQTQSSVYAL